MVFKLIRSDNTIEPEKIVLSIGTHLIGRGKLLGCDDKRVSRNHGELEVTQHSVSIKSLHENPCFYVRRSTKKSNVLAKDSTIYLSHGDKFGLLPHTYWYELIDIPTDQDTTPFENAKVAENHVNDVKRQSDTPRNNSGNDTVINNQPLSSNLKVNENNLSSANENKSVTPTPLIPDQNDVAKTIKRSNSTSDNSDPVDVKKVKIEPDDSKDVKPGPSNEPKTVAAGEANNETKDSNNTPAETLPRVRERCFYGGHCYRRNTKHRARFSHPQDADWGTEERPACHMGPACRRHALRHWRDYTHPDGVRPPVTPTPEPGLTNNPQGKSNQTDKNKEQSKSNKKQVNCQEEEDDCEEEDEFEEEEECEDEESDFEEEAEEEMCPEDVDNLYY